MPSVLLPKATSNLQNRHDLLKIEEVKQMNGWNSNLNSNQRIYKLKKDDTIRLVLYTTDFEITIRDNTDYQLTVDLSQSSLEIPYQK